LVALCAARSIEKPGDIYLDDAAHHALTRKFADDFASQGGALTHYPPDKVSAAVERQESNNPNRDWWDRTYGDAK
jgi:hypothetical protein